MFMCNLLKYEKIKQGKFTCVAIKMENTKFDTVRGKIDTLTHTLLFLMQHFKQDVKTNKYIVWFCKYWKIFQYNKIS
jgi:hypothetical protein